MTIAIRTYNQIKSKDFNLDPDFNVDFKQIQENYHNFLAGYKTIRLGDFLSIKTCEKALKGDLIIETKYFKQFRIYITDKDLVKTVSKIEINNKSVTKSYLIWCLNQKPIADYINLFSKGTVISYIPITTILKIKIPLQKKHTFMKSAFFNSKGQFKQVVENYLITEFHKCKNNNLILASVVLSGSIVESILSQLLVDNGVKEAHLKNKTLGAIIEFAKIEGVIEGDLCKWCLELSQLRNFVHANKLVDKTLDMKGFGDRAYLLFDQIIKEVGI